MLPCQIEITTNIIKILLSFVKIFLYLIQIRNHAPAFQCEEKFGIQFFIPDTFSSAFLHPFPEPLQFLKTHVVKLCPSRVEDQQKGDPSLTLKFLHKFYLMPVYILKREGVRRALFGIEADRNPLHGADIIDGTSLVEIRQGNVPVFFVDPDRSDRRWNLLNQSKAFVAVLFICVIDIVLQGRTPQSSRCPCGHVAAPFSL